jgi:hypothetical protein
MIARCLSGAVPIYKLHEWHTLIEKELLPLLKKHGIQQVAMLQCDIGGQLGEFMWWFTFEDAADQEQKIQALREDTDYRKVMQKVSEFAPDITVKTYRPTSYS